MSACCSLSRCSASTSCPLLGKGCKPKPLRQRGSQAPCPPPATASAEGAQLNGRPFPATASAEGRQFNGAPSLWERVRAQHEFARVVEAGRRRTACHLIHKPNKSWSNSP